MNTFVAVVGWCLLFVLCWPLAILALLLWPLVWLVSLPFRLIGISLEAVFALLRAILMLPARLLAAARASALRGRERGGSAGPLVAPLANMGRGRRFR